MSKLTLREQQKLSACESDIETGANQMQRALKMIHDEKLWKGEYDSFEDYCEKRWSIKKSNAYRLVNHENVIANLTDAGVDSTMVEKISPRATDQISSLPPETQAEVVKKATQNGQKPTVKAVKAAKAELVEPSRQSQVADFFGGSLEESEQPAQVVASVVKDATGRDVPSHLRVPHALGSAIDSTARRLDQIRQSVLDLADEPGGEFLDVTLIESDCKRLKGLISQSRYWSHCPRCSGGDCDLCDSNGWIPFNRRGLLTDAEKEEVNGVPF